MINDKYIKKRLDFRLKKYNLEAFEQISFKDNFIEEENLKINSDEILLIDNYNANGFVCLTYHSIIIKENGSLRTINFDCVSEVEIDYESFYNPDNKNLVDSAVSVSKIIIKIKDEDSVQLNVSNNGAVYMYKDLIEHGSWLVAKQSLETRNDSNREEKDSKD